jgi:hypothetical protein
VRRILYWLGAVLVIGVTAGASYLRPDVVVWMAWGNAALFWLAARNEGERVKLAEASRDRWRKLHTEIGDALGGQLGVERVKAKRLIRELSDTLESQRIMLDKQAVEIERLKAKCDQLEVERVGAWESHGFAQQRADRYEAFIQWLKKRGYITVALVDQFMKLEERTEA